MTLGKGHLIVSSLFICFIMLSIIERLCDALNVNDEYVILRLKRKEAEILDKFKNEIDFFTSQYGKDLMVLTNYTVDKNRSIFINYETSIVRDTGIFFPNKRKEMFFGKKLDEFKRGVIQEDILMLTIMNILSDTVHFIIRYKNITVENEFGKSTFIEELFVDIPICTSFGNKVLLAPIMTRAKFSKNHLACGYMHSHAKSIQMKFDMNWRSLCFGNGPMAGLIMNIRTGITTLEESLPMISFNMDRFVTVESIKGVPYVKLENVHSVNFYKNGIETKLSTVKNPVDCKIEECSRETIREFFESKKVFPSFTTMFINHLIANNPIRTTLNSKSIGGIPLKYKVVYNVYMYDFAIKITNIFNDTMALYALMIGVKFEDIYNYMNDKFFGNYIVNIVRGKKCLVKVSNDSNGGLSDIAVALNEFVNDNKNTEIMVFNGERILFSCDTVEPIEEDDKKYLRLLTPQFLDFVMSIINEYC